MPPKDISSSKGKKRSRASPGRNDERELIWALRNAMPSAVIRNFTEFLPHMTREQRDNLLLAEALAQDVTRLPKRQAMSGGGQYYAMKGMYARHQADMTRKKTEYEKQKKEQEAVDKAPYIPEHWRFFWEDDPSGPGGGGFNDGGAGGGGVSV